MAWISSTRAYARQDPGIMISHDTAQRFLNIGLGAVAVAFALCIAKLFT
jgi:hypothetical protein